MKVLKIQSVFLLMVVSFILILMVSGANATTENVQGTISKVIGSIIFLDKPEQPAYHAVETSQMGTVSSLSELVGKTVSITYHAEGNRNIIDSMQVILK